jgi:hypothetical protein
MKKKKMHVFSGTKTGNLDADKITYTLRTLLKPETVCDPEISRYSACTVKYPSCVLWIA